MLLNPKYLRLALVGAGLIVVVAILVSSSHGTPSLNSQCGPYRTDKVVTIASQKFNTEVAATSVQKVAGLGGRPCIESNQAMLFDFGKPSQYAIWMKDMRFPIDIVWINVDHKVVGVESGVEPSTYHSKNPYFINDKNHIAQYVLELKSHRTDELHITIGTPVQF